MRQKAWRKTVVIRNRFSRGARIITTTVCYRLNPREGRKKKNPSKLIWKYINPFDFGGDGMEVFGTTRNSRDWSRFITKNMFLTGGEKFWGLHVLMGWQASAQGTGGVNFRKGWYSDMFSDRFSTPIVNQFLGWWNVNFLMMFILIKRDKD